MNNDYRCCLLFLVAMHLFLIANIVTTSKALVTSSDALVPSCLLFLVGLVLVAWSAKNRRVTKPPPFSKSSPRRQHEVFAPQLLQGPTKKGNGLLAKGNILKYMVHHGTIYLKMDVGLQTYWTA